MGAGHSHSHGHLTAGGTQLGRLLAVLGVTAGVMAVEIVGGLLTGSLALLADAGHMLTDVAGIGLSVLAIRFAAKAPTLERTFGYYRAEILAAVVNSLLLLGVAILILGEAWRRFADQLEVEGGPMLAFALVAVVANLGCLLLLRPGASTSLNVKAAYVDVLGDLLGSAAVVIAALVVAGTGWEQADPVASVLVALMILPRTWSLLREAVDVLLEATPKGIDLREIRRHILETEGVLDAHDLHVWTITSGMPVLSVHVVVTDEALADGGGGAVLDRLGHCLAHHFDVEHCTFQLEPAGHADHELGAH
jgi:cobalt-zinc-cadmium efflux system protein